MKKLSIFTFVFLIFAIFSTHVHPMEEQQEQIATVHNLCLFVDVSKAEAVEKPLNSIANDCAITFSRETAPTLIFDAKIFDIIVAMSEDFINEHCQSQSPESCKILSLVKTMKQKIKALEESDCQKAKKKTIFNLQQQISQEVYKYSKKQYTDNLFCYLCLTNFEKQNFLYKISLQTKTNKNKHIGYLIIPIQYLNKFNLTKDSSQKEILRTLRFNTEHPKLTIEKISLNHVKQKTSTSDQFKPKLEAFKPSIIKNLLLAGDEFNVWHIYWTGHGSATKDIGGIKYNSACKLLNILEYKYTALLHINSCYFGNSLANKVLLHLNKQRKMSSNPRTPMLISTQATADISTQDYYTQSYKKERFKALLNKELQNNKTQIKKQILDPIYPYIYTPNMKKFFDSLEAISNSFKTIPGYHFGGIQLAVLPEECIAVFKPAYSHLLQHRSALDQTVLTNIPQLFIPEEENKNTIIHIQTGITKITPENNVDIIIDNKNLIIIDCHIIEPSVEFKNIHTEDNKLYCRCFFQHIKIPYYIFKKIKVDDLRIQEFIHKILFHTKEADYLKPITVVIACLTITNSQNGKKKHFKNIFIKCHGETKTQALAECGSLPIQIKHNQALVNYSKGKKDIRKKIKQALKDASDYGISVGNNYFTFINKENYNSSNLQG